MGRNNRGLGVGTICFTGQEQEPQEAAAVALRKSPPAPAASSCLPLPFSLLQGWKFENSLPGYIFGMGGYSLADKASDYTLPLLRVRRRTVTAVSRAYHRPGPL